MIVLELTTVSAVLPVETSGPGLPPPAILIPAVLGPDPPPPRPNLLLPGFDAAGGPLQLALSFQSEGVPGAKQSTGHLQGPDLPQPPPKK